MNEPHARRGARGVLRPPVLAGAGRVAVRGSVRSAATSVEEALWSLRDRTELVDRRADDP